MGGCEWGDCLSCYQECGESPLKPLKTSAAGLPFLFPFLSFFGHRQVWTVTEKGCKMLVTLLEMLRINVAAVERE